VIDGLGAKLGRELIGCEWHSPYNVGQSLLAVMRLLREGDGFLTYESRQVDAVVARKGKERRIGKKGVRGEER